MSLYSILLIGTISIPLLLSFDKRLRFYKQWKYLFPSLVVVAAFFILFDILFTGTGIWGFNPTYHSDRLIFNIPVEEWLFFLIVPYASIFLHESIVLYFPSLKPGLIISRVITFLLIALFVAIALFNMGKTYTLYTSALMVATLLIAWWDPSKTIQPFYFTFLVILIPFMAVNGILTGSLIDGEVVWYNDNENIGIRVLTIPVEDFGYGFSLILLNLMLKERLRQIISKRDH